MNVKFVEIRLRLKDSKRYLVIMSIMSINSARSALKSLKREFAETLYIEETRLEREIINESRV